DYYCAMWHSSAFHIF
nr:immunoglobulin light chain junction region [Macaca mulatta]MOX28807.1 immunoglobulin light chain junction region [Macaca mulatta]MOX29296.1 immunoglobulin light chain junction region [Macaca mulatta]MOX30083.1 immunoglobulin light chain junction region [Macaca mulatta]MOX30255.1 immunoglobulin light chain junction region [Macaca mulatta]